VASILDYSFVFIIAVFLPYVVIKSARRLAAAGAPAPDKRRSLIATIINLEILGYLAIVVAYRRGEAIFVPWHPTGREIGIGIVLLIALLQSRYLLRGWIRKTQPRYARFMAPRSWAEFPLWTLVSICAGFFEEIIYRGVLYQILFSLTGSVPAAVLFAVVPFGIVHWRQGIRSVVFITVLSVMLHGLVLFSGTLYMAMIVHTTYDFLAGI